MFQSCLILYSAHCAPWQGQLPGPLISTKAFKHCASLFLSCARTVFVVLTQCSLDPTGSTAVAPGPPSTHCSESLHLLTGQLNLYVLWDAFQDTVRKVVLSFWPKQKDS